MSLSEMKQGTLVDYYELARVLNSLELGLEDLLLVGSGLAPKIVGSTHAVVWQRGEWVVRQGQGYGVAKPDPQEY